MFNVLLTFLLRFAYQMYIKNIVNFIIKFIVENITRNLILKLNGHTYFRSHYIYKFIIQNPRV